MLSLSSGQSFDIVWNPTENEYDLPYRKLKDIKVVRSSDEHYLHIQFKDGRKEIIDFEEGLLREVISPSGLSIKLDYRLFNFEYVLERIHDGMGCEVSFDAWSNDWE